jgi:hypothetical protein
MPLGFIHGELECAGTEIGRVVPAEFDGSRCLLVVAKVGLEGKSRFAADVTGAAFGPGTGDASLSQGDTSHARESVASKTIWTDRSG